MAVPDFQSLMLPLLRLAADRAEHSLGEARESLAKEFGLTDADLTEPLPSGRQSKFANRVAWPKSYLQQAGLFLSPKRGHFQVTDRGRQVLASPPPRITIRFLEQYPEFLEFRDRSDDEEVVTSVPGAEPECETPEEALSAAYVRMRAALASEVLARVKAKKWDGTVGRPEIQKFVGALHGKRAKKGVFITTGSFSSDAGDYVAHIDPKVVLIDGHRLAELMIDFDTGVSTSRTFHVKRVDSDYFDEG
jgi:restriction system protein